jgi:hypothetical protein
MKEEDREIDIATYSFDKDKPSEEKHHEEEDDISTDVDKMYDEE